VEDELSEIADELYALHPNDFSSARDERIKKAKADKQAPLAKALGQLRKPTQSAWLVNQLWRDQRDVMEQLFELSGELSQAQRSASGDELRELTQQRRAIEMALMQQARALANKSKVNLSPEMEREVQETLSAALAEPEHADEVRTGRLVKPIEYAGFGTLATGAAAAAKPRAAAPAKEPVSIEDAKRAREREKLERRVAEARAEVENAASIVEEQTKAADEAESRYDELRDQLLELQKQVRQLERDINTAEKQVRDTKALRERAEREHAAAQRALERAEQGWQNNDQPS
jgi:chromosome segregation ATPase